MKAFNIQIIEIIIILGSYIISYFIFKTVINNFLKKTQLESGTRKIVTRALQLFASITALIILTGVWGFKQNEIALFASTILTALSVAFFGQWSLHSNITSSILIFFNRSVKLGDCIKVLNKDYNYEGEVAALSYFFVQIKTADNEIIKIPNSHFFEKSIFVSENTEKYKQPIK